MRTRRTSDAAWSEAAARRLAQLTADLGGARPPAEPCAPADGTAADAWWADHTRVSSPEAAERSSASSTAPTHGPAAAPAGWPRPGRHASRRRRAPTWRLPELGAAQVAVVAVLVAVGLALTTWWVVRDRAEPVAPVPVAEASPLVAGLSAPEDSTGPSAGATTSHGEVTVDVTGKVRHPGIVVLDAGARVVDALEEAGGARPGVDLASLNLARVLVDGEQIVVGQPSVAPPVVPPGSATTPAAPTQLVNLNLATEAELDTLPEVGPVTAAAIVAWRDEHGGFTSVDELLEVNGIGEVTLEQIAPYVTV